jgi:hypothetical protein
VTDFTNSVFFWAMLPETKKLALEEMNMLFSEPLFFISNRSEKVRRDCGIGGAAMLQDEKARAQTEEEEHVEWLARLYLICQKLKQYLSLSLLR